MANVAVAQWYSFFREGGRWFKPERFRERTKQIKMLTVASLRSAWHIKYSLCSIWLFAINFRSKDEMGTIWYS